MDNYKRREFIRLNALAFASIALQFSAISTYAQKANANFGNWNAKTQLNWDAFLERLTELAKAQDELHWKQKRYTKQVKKLLLQCNFPEFENVKKEIENYENKRPNWFESASLHYEIDLQVSLFQFEKGEYIPHHDHPNMTGVLNVVSGNLLARNYTIEKHLDSIRKVEVNGKKNVIRKCVIKEVENEILKAGDVSILTSHEGNIHSIMPNDFTQLVDVFTPAYKHDTNANWYKVNEDGLFQGKRKLYEAEYSNTMF